MTLKELFETNKIILSTVSTAAVMLRRQNLDRGVRLFRAALPHIEKSFAFIVDNNIVPSDEAMGLLSMLMEAQQNKDYILLSDTITSRLEPFITGIQTAVQNEADSDDIYNDNFDENTEYLRTLGEDYRTLLEILSKDDEGRCIIESTDRGPLTLKRKNSEGTAYIHSGIDPISESRTLVEDFLAGQIGDIDEYAVFGLGLMYHIKMLGEETMWEFPITVYEPDADVIRAAFHVNAFKHFHDKGVNIVYDPDAKGFADKIGREKTPGIMIHYPSLGGVDNADIRRSLNRFFIQSESAKNAGRLLDNNFRENIKMFKSGRIKLFSDIRGRLQDKSVIIVAAGPSLDKNIDELIDIYNRKNADIVILALGTVYKKLLRSGIVPDAVIVTDPNSRVVGQVRGIGEINKDAAAGVPLILLATASKGYAKEYGGPKYMICQNGYERAESFAKENGQVLFETGGSVATTALDVMIRCRAKRIIFVGLDLAFTDNFAHAEGTSNRIATDAKDLTEVESWREESSGIKNPPVLSDDKFIIYKKWMEKRVSESDTHEVINATEGGSYIRGMKHIRLNDAALKLSLEEERK